MVGWRGRWRRDNEIYFHFIVSADQTEVYSRVGNSLKGGEEGKEIQVAMEMGAEVLQGPLWLVKNAQHVYYIAHRRRAQRAPQGFWFSGSSVYVSSDSSAVLGQKRWCCRIPAWYLTSVHENAWKADVYHSQSLTPTVCREMELLWTETKPEWNRMIKRPVVLSVCFTHVTWWRLSSAKWPVTSSEIYPYRSFCYMSLSSLPAPHCSRRQSDLRQPLTGDRN